MTSLVECQAVRIFIGDRYVIVSLQALGILVQARMQYLEVAVHS